MKILIPFMLFFTAFVLPQSVAGQLMSVSGYVNNQLSGQAMESAAVYESISGIGTITNQEGYYRLLLNRGNQHLKVSSFGYDTVSLKFTMTADTIISFDLKPVNESADKIVAKNRHHKDSAGSVEPSVSPGKDK